MRRNLFLRNSALEFDRNAWIGKLLHFRFGTLSRLDLRSISEESGLRRIAVYWIISKLVMLTYGLSGWLGLPIGILLGIFFYRGILGTFALHRIKKEKKARELMTYANR
jgi:hypothetical protein